MILIKFNLVYFMEFSGSLSRKSLKLDLFMQNKKEKTFTFKPKIN